MVDFTAKVGRSGCCWNRRDETQLASTESDPNTTPRADGPGTEGPATEPGEGGTESHPDRPAEGGDAPHAAADARRRKRPPRREP